MTLLRLARDRRYDVDAIFEGLSRDILRPAVGRRASWNEIATLFERLDAADPGAIEAFASHYVHRLPVVSFITSYVFTADGLYRVLFFGWRRLWPMLNFEATRTPNGWRLEARLEPSLRGCEPFLRLATEVLRRAPVLVGQPFSEVEAVVASAWQATWHVATGTAEHKRQDEADLDTDGLFARAWDEMLLGERAAAPPPIPASWNLSPAETRVIEILRTGKDVDAIARALCVSRETVRTHLKRAMSKAGVNRQVELIARLYAP